MRHSSLIGSGTHSPSWAVATTITEPAVTSWLTSVADVGVEEVDVVDTEHERASAAEVGDRGAGGDEQRDALVVVDLARQQRSERGEGQIGDRRATADEAGDETRRLGDADELLGEAGHAATGGTVQDEAATSVGEQPLETAHLSGVPHERSAYTSRDGRPVAERLHAVSSMSEWPDPLMTGRVRLCLMLGLM